MTFTSRRTVGRTLVTIIVVVMAGAAWTPTSSPVENFGCLLCGERALADFLLNIPFFVPLGIAVGLAGGRRRPAVLFVVSVTATIELVQQFIPGRDASLTDILANGMGGIVGLFLIHHAGTLLDPPNRLARKLAWVIAAVASTMFLITAYLLTPETGTGSEWIQWNPQLPRSTPFGGQVQTVTLNGDPLPAGPTSSTDVSASFADPFVLRIITGPNAGTDGDVFRVRQLEGARRVIEWDNRWVETIGVSVVDNTLLLRRRTRAAGLTLAQSEMRFRGWLHPAPVPASLDLEVSFDGREYCAEIADVRRCRSPNTPGRGWALLFPPQFNQPPAGYMLSALWIASAFAAFAFFARTVRMFVAGGTTLVGALLIVPLVWPAAAVPLVEWFAVGAGMGVGFLLRTPLRRVSGSLPGRPDTR